VLADSSAIVVTTIDNPATITVCQIKWYHSSISVASVFRRANTQAETNDTCDPTHKSAAF